MGQDVVKFYFNKKRQPGNIQYDDELIYVEGMQVDKLVIGDDWVITTNKNNELVITYKDGLVGKWIPVEQNQD